MLKLFIRDSLIYTIPYVISRAFSIFLIPLYTRVMSPADYGSLDMILMFSSFAGVTISLEIAQAVARFFPDEKTTDRKNIIFSTAFFFVIATNTLFCAACLLWSGKLSELIIGRRGTETTFYSCIIYIWGTNVFYFLQNQLRWQLKSREYAMVSLISSLIMASVSVYFAYILKLGLIGVLTGMITGSIAGLLIDIFLLRKSFCLKFNKSYFKEMLAFSIPLVPSGISVFLSLYIDRLMIKNYLGLEEVGIYGIACRISSIVGLVMAGIQSALTPLIYNHYKNADTPKQIADIFRIFILSALFIFMILSLFSPEIIRLMTTPEYYSADGIVMIMVPAVILSQMYIFAPGIDISKKTYLIFIINFTGALFNIILNFILIPSLGIKGAALAKVAGYGCIFCAYLYFSQSLYKVPHRWMPLIATVLSVVFVTILSSKYQLNLALKFSILVVVPVFSLSYGFISKKDVVRIYDRFQK